MKQIKNRERTQQVAEKMKITIAKPEVNRLDDVEFKVN